MKTQINEQTQNANNIQVRIVARKKRILDDDVVITQDNNLRIGEIIAVATIKTVMCRSGKNLYWLYDGLIQDCKRRADVNHIYSDGYDIAQTAALFLCEHIGKQLGDTYITACGKVITIKQACFRFVDRYLDKQYTRHLAYTTVTDDNVKKKVKQTIRREKSLFFSSLEIFYGLKIKNKIKSRYANKRV